jgi:hypothetical protein
MRRVPGTENTRLFSGTGTEKIKEPKFRFLGIPKFLKKFDNKLESLGDKE